MKTGTTPLIATNIAPPNIKRLAVFKGTRKLGIVDISNMRLPDDIGIKLYSIGALSDVHIGYDTADTDFQSALTYLNDNANVAFTCVCGDLTADGTAPQLSQYKAIVDSYSADRPVHSIVGNHENYSNYATTNPDYLMAYTGHPLYYSFTHGDDVYIMCGTYCWHEGNTQYEDRVFTQEYLQWLYGVLEENRNKRCFVFEHVFPWGDSGNPENLYSYNMAKGTLFEVFLSLLKHYKNTVLFHGHSHTKFNLQTLDKKANYSEVMGYRSVHIPSLAVPRDVNESGSCDGEIYEQSEGYVIDIYSNHIVLRGMDFVRNEIIPIAQYCLDTTLQPVDAGTYIDGTGTIET